MLYIVIEEVWSVWTKDAEPQLLSSSPPLGGGDKAMAETLAEELAGKFGNRGHEENAAYPYWWGRNDGEPESHRFIVRSAA
jgi:hypothetical protein